jgi:hypothetical protein
MRQMDEHFQEHPYKGARRMHVWLTKVIYPGRLNIAWVDLD